MKEIAETPQYPDDLLNDRQRAFVRMIQLYGEEGILSESLNELLRGADLSLDEYRKLVDSEVLENASGALAKEVRMRVKSTFSRTRFLSDRQKGFLRALQGFESEIHHDLFSNISNRLSLSPEELETLKSLGLIKEEKVGLGETKYTLAVAKSSNSDEATD